MEFIFLHVACLIFQHICVSFSHSLSAPCLLTHACVNRLLVTRRFPSYFFFLYKPWNHRLKKNPFREKKSSSPRPREQCSPQLWTPPTLFPLQAPIGCLQREKAPQILPIGSTVMFICNHEVVCCMFALYIPAFFELINCVMLSFTEQRICNLTCSV